MTDHKSAWITSMGIIIAAFVFGLFFYSSRISDRTIRVVGYATQDFEADIAGYGIHSTSTRKKTIKVTVNAVFSID